MLFSQRIYAVYAWFRWLHVNFTFHMSVMGFLFVVIIKLPQVPSVWPQNWLAALSVKLRAYLLISSYLLFRRSCDVITGVGKRVLRNREWWGEAQPTLPERKQLMAKRWKYLYTAGVTNTLATLSVFQVQIVFFSELWFWECLVTTWFEVLAWFSSSLSHPLFRQRDSPPAANLRSRKQAKH